MLKKKRQLFEKLLMGFLCALIFLRTQSLQGQIIASDDFDSYSLGQLSNGANGGSNWSGSWSVSGSNTSVVDLSVALPGQGYFAGDHGISFTGNNNAPIRRNFSSQTGDVFISFEFTLANGAVNSNDFAALWLQTNSYPNGPSIGLKGDQARNNSNNFDLFARTRGGNEVYSGPNLVVGETYTIVGQLYKASSGTYNRYALWVDPGYADFASPGAVSSSDTGYASVDRLGFRLVNMDGSDQVLINNLTFAQSWDDVVPNVVPEPAHYGLGLGVIVTIFVVVRKRLQKTAERK